jgi:hypothetical protein
MQEEKAKKLSYHNKEEFKYDHSTPPSYSKHFNYPFLSRKDLMYLSSLNSRDYPLRYFKKINTNRDWSANLYNLDIEKSVPFRSNIFTNKIDFINKLDDIEKSRPAKDKTNCVDPNKIIYFNLNTRDIEGAYPKKQDFSNRITNPLEPVYKLPSCEILDKDPPPKFIRDNIDVSDIPGTKSKPIYRNQLKTNKNDNNENNNDDNDIPGSHPRKKYERKIFYENFDYTDVNINDKKKFFSNINNRNTNPLEPNYGSLYGGFIEKSVPFNPVFHVKNRGRIYMSNDDIFGSICGSKNRYNLFLNKPNYALNVNDINGAITGTLKRCSKNETLKRMSNPLMPKYEYLGDKEIKGNKRYYNDSVNDINKINNVNNINNKNINNDNNINNSQNLQTLDVENLQKYNNNIEKFPKTKLNISKSCKDLYFPNIYKYPKYNIEFNNIENNNNNNNINNQNFDPETYKKPNPNYERIHNPLLLFSQKNRNNRLDVQMKKTFGITDENNNSGFNSNGIDNNIFFKDSNTNDCSINYNKKLNLMKSRSMENINNDIYDNNSHLSLTSQKIKEDPLYNRLRSPPSYEEQLTNFIKDNSYNFKD